MLKSSLCDYSDVYILVSGTITIDGAGADDSAKRSDERSREVFIYLFIYLFISIFIQV